MAPQMLKMGGPLVQVRQPQNGGSACCFFPVCLSVGVCVSGLPACALSCMSCLRLARHQDSCCHAAVCMLGHSNLLLQGQACFCVGRQPPQARPAQRHICCVRPLLALRGGAVCNAPRVKSAAGLQARNFAGTDYPSFHYKS